MDFTEAQIRRYARHILLPQVGGKGQEALLESRVLVIGAGGLGSPVLLYLAAAGIGTLGIVDDDRVDLSNLQRQVIHTTDRIGVPKVDSAYQAITAINPDVTVQVCAERLTVDNAADLFSGYDLVADCSDNFETRFLVNDTAVRMGRTLVSAAVLRFEGQLWTVRPGGEGPCCRCLFREPPPAGDVPSCAEAGILGAVAGVTGTLQATEILKEILGIGEGLCGRMLVYDALSARMRTVTAHRDPECPLCSGPSGEHGSRRQAVF